MSFYVETLHTLLRIDASGYFLRQRFISEISTSGSPKAALFRRVLPLDSLRFRIFLAIIVRLLRLYLRLETRRSSSRRRTLPHTPEVQRVEQDTRELHFLRPAAHEVVVLIPVHNNWATTELCLRSLMMTSVDTPYRLMVVNDGSTDETAERLAATAGIDVVQLDENVGFLRAVHAGFAAASEPYVVLLNNDTVVTDGWLDALYDTMRHDPTTGVVGAMLLYPDGVLQEAGSLIFSNGRGVNYGKGDDATRAWYASPREVDYCSGACIIVRHSAWVATGGFDLDFAPAYYEETDFAFSVRKAGYRVLYQPAARIYHFEGVTYGRDESPKKKALMDTNRARLQTKWATELAAQWEQGVSHQVGQSWRSARGRILVVDSSVPQTDKDAGSIRMFEIVRILRDLGFAVTFMSMRGTFEEPYVSQLRQLEVEVINGRANYGLEIHRLAPVLRAAILSRPDDAKVTENLVRHFAPEAAVIYDTVDLHFVREARRATVENDPSIEAIAEEYRELEVGLVRRSDATIVVTDTERDILHDIVPEATIAVVPTIHSAHQRTVGFGPRRDILFVGNFNHLPNRDAVTWFVEEVLPLVREQLTEVSFRVVGSHLPDSIAELARPGVEIIGWVHDLTPLYDEVRLVVAPLRYGAGIKGKLGESASRGVPFVCTAIATEGTTLTNERDCLIASEPREFADAVIRLYSDETVWERLSTNAQAAIEAQCSPAVAHATLSTLLTSLNL